MCGGIEPDNIGEKLQPDNPEDDISVIPDSQDEVDETSISEPIPADPSTSSQHQEGPAEPPAIPVMNANAM